MDMSGSKNHLPVTTGAGMVVPVSGASGFDGLNGQPHLRGNTSVCIDLPTLPAQYTLFHIARYVGTANRQRVRVPAVAACSGSRLGGCAARGTWRPQHTLNA